MSFDQALICHGKGGIYAASWLAGTSGSQALTKYYKKHDIDSVNIGKTCDSLSLALKSEFSATQQNHDPTDTDHCMVKEGSIPFRVCTNIWFGTLKIYQQQVNNLYKQSEKLLASSSCYDAPEISQKRKGHSSGDHQPLKKRRLTITETNYSQLLDDFEKWTQQKSTPDRESEELSFSSNVKPSKNLTVRPRAHLQIREITIREICATSYGITELDEDDGFGEATNDEITQFFTHSDCQEQNNFITQTRTTPKRKSCYEDEPPHKLNRNDTIVENDNYESTPLAGDFMPTPKRYQGTCENIHNPPTNPCEITLHNENERNDMISTVLLNDIKEEPCENDHPPNLEATEKLNLENILTNVNTTKKMFKLIIDKYIKIEQEDMIQQINAPTKLLRGKTIESIRKLKYKKRTPATELLKRLNKRTEKFSQTLKQKNVVNFSQSQFEHDYIELLQDILKIDYKDEWLTEVHPKWNNAYQAPAKTLKNNQADMTCKTLKEAICCKSPTNLNFLHENPDIVFNDENNNPTEKKQKYLTVTTTTMQMQQDNNNENLLNSETSTEWRPYGIMVKLLETWRYCTDTKIDAVDFCHSAKTGTDKALAFLSLLSLAKDQFIEITKRPETINMDKILLGNTVKYLLKTEK